MTHAIAVTQDNWLAHHNLGVAYLDQGRLAEAVTQLEEALRIKPKYTTAHLNFGSAYSAMGRISDAERECRLAIKLGPNEVEAYNNLGKLYLDQKRPDEASVWFQQALRIKPDFLEPHINLGNALDEAGRFPEPSNSTAKRSIYARTVRWPITTSPWRWTRAAPGKRPFPTFGKHCVSTPISSRRVSVWEMPSVAAEPADTVIRPRNRVP